MQTIARMERQSAIFMFFCEKNVGEFDEYMAKSYYIDGPRGGVKKIALPRNLVVIMGFSFFSFCVQRYD